MMTAVVVEQASQWPAAQRAFRLAYLGDPTPWPRTSVRYQVMGGAPFADPPWLLQWIPIGWIATWIGSRLLRRRPVNIDAFMAVFRLDDESDELIFEFSPRPSREVGHGVIVGEFAMNGALVLELDDGTVVWPTYNPRRPITPDAPVE